MFKATVSLLLIAAATAAPNCTVSQCAFPSTGQCTGPPDGAGNCTCFAEMPNGDCPGDTVHCSTITPGRKQCHRQRSVRI